MTKGFTMIEVLVAVLILGLVVTASLKLIALSEHGLYTVRQKEKLIDEASRLQVMLMNDPTRTSGTSDDASWNVEEKKSPLWMDETIDLDKLTFESDRSDDKFKKTELRWRELEVTRNGMSMTLFLPYRINLKEATSADIMGLLDGK